MKKTVLLLSTLLTLSVTCVSANASTTPKGAMVGQLNYKKTKMTTKINKNYKSFKLYNHVPTSNYANIKKISWTKTGLNLRKISTTPVKINMMASQGTQYNWYRFSVSKKVNHKKVTTNYWIYGQALALSNVNQNIMK